MTEDLISRQAVLDAFDCSIDGVPFEAVKYVIGYANKMKSRINALPSTQPEQRWIPVSERLPEKNVEVLVTTEWDCITIGEMFSRNNWLIHEGATNADIDDIKAWMPLPAPFEPKERSDKP